MKSLNAPAGYSGGFLIAPTAYPSRPADPISRINETFSKLQNTVGNVFEKYSNLSLKATVTYRNWKDYLANNGVLGDLQRMWYWVERSKNPKADVPDTLYDAARESSLFKPAELNRSSVENNPQKASNIDDIVRSAPGSGEDKQYGSYKSGYFKRAREAGAAATEYMKSLFQPLAKIFERLRSGVYRDDNTKNRSDNEKYDESREEIDASISAISKPGFNEVDKKPVLRLISGRHDYSRPIPNYSALLEERLAA